MRSTASLSFSTLTSVHANATCRVDGHRATITWLMIWPSPVVTQGEFRTLPDPLSLVICIFMRSPALSRTRHRIARRVGVTLYAVRHVMHSKFHPLLKCVIFAELMALNTHLFTKYRFQKSVWPIIIFALFANYCLFKGIFFSTKLRTRPCGYDKFVEFVTHICRGRGRVCRTGTECIVGDASECRQMLAVWWLIGVTVQAFWGRACCGCDQLTLWKFEETWKFDEQRSRYYH